MPQPQRIEPCADVNMSKHASMPMVNTRVHAFFSFGPLAPEIAQKFDVQALEFILPMNLAASMGRTVSPVSGVLIATSEIAKVAPIQVVRRNIIPLLVGLIVMILYHFI